MTRVENKLGMNRTGRDTSPALASPALASPALASPALAKDMLDATEELTLLRRPDGSSAAIGENRMESMRSDVGVGSVPLPATVKGALKAGLQKIAGNDPALLVDKLGERLAFERTGVRLYDALISKFKAQATELPAAVSLERLEEIRAEELSHFVMVHQVMQELGADPTAVTPAADVAGVTSMGLVKALGDPRIGFGDSLDAILVAELADNDAWRLLIELVTEAGLRDAAERFRVAWREEQEHLWTVRDWIYHIRLGRSAQGSDVGAA